MNKEPANPTPSGGVTELVRQIKQELRAMMNGVASAAMRQAGMTADYRVNFGVELPRLTALLDDVKNTMLPSLLVPDEGTNEAALAQQLWHESVRECRILATMLYPPTDFLPEVADIWVKQISSVEIAQIAAMNLFNKMPMASDKAFQWIAAEDDMTQIVGYYTLLHLLRQYQLSERSAQELRDQATAALLSDNLQLRMAAQKALSRLE